MRACAYARVCMCARICVCVRAYACLSVYVPVCVRVSVALHLGVFDVRQRITVCWCVCVCVCVCGTFFPSSFLFYYHVGRVSLVCLIGIGLTRDGVL